MDDPAQKSAPAPGQADEFAGIPSPRTRHPALALGAVALAGYLVFHIRADLGYALSRSDALDLGDARALFSNGPAALATNRYVRVRGVPDRESAVELDTKGSWKFSQFFRVLGTGGRMFVHRRDDPLPRERAERDVFTGRLIAFSDLSFQGAIRSYFASHISATHFFRAKDLLLAAGKPGVTLRDLTGDPVVVGQRDVLAVDVARPGELEVGFPRERFSDETAARAEVERRGGAVSRLAPGGAPDRHSLVVRFAVDGLPAAIAELADLDRRMSIRAGRETFKVTLGDLTAEGDVLVIKDRGGSAGGPIRVALAEVQSVRTLATVEIPPDAYLLVESERPRDHVARLVIAAALGGFALVNLLGVRRGWKVVSPAP